MAKTKCLQQGLQFLFQNMSVIKRTNEDFRLILYNKNVMSQKKNFFSAQCTED